MSEKKSQREQSLKLRDQAHVQDDGMAARKITAQIIMLPELDEVRNISGYIPIRSEVDCMVILKALHAAQFPICLPSITDRDKPLEFRAWDMRTELQDGPFKTKQSTGQIVAPAVLLVPLVAFDGHGARLGYGGGYYDRTLQTLRAENPDLVTIGIAYDDQKLASVPTDGYDQSLDMVVTEKTTYRFK
jgi:5-formyltetrahydrofolate cyclo-ligase|tara:strand:- start:61875 stop:62438 length:564 start_codon:yes stop_codon:yes gene_type:complete